MYSTHLKSATAELHKQVEAIPALTAQISEKVIIEDYADALTLLYYLHSSFESQIYDRVDPEFIETSGMQPRLSALKLDLHDLGRSPSTTVASQTALQNQAMALGASYVLEGSLLGGQFIVRHLLKSLAKDQLPIPVRFHHFYGNTVFQHWKHFKVELDRYALELKLPVKQISNGAEMVYQSLLEMNNAAIQSIIEDSKQ